MNEMTIGMENLPNIFIDKILVEQDQSPGTKKTKIVVRVGAYDNIDVPRWKRSEMQEAGLKIKCVLETDIEKINNLNDGSSSLFDYDELIQVPQIGNPGPFKFSAKAISSIDLIEGPRIDPFYAFYYKDITFNISGDISNLNAYASFFIDGLQFENNIFNKFYGPLTGESIFFSGQINNSTNYFYNPETNEEYGGPVHQHPGRGFMEGSEHSAQPHNLLVKVEEENFKITHELRISNTTAVAPTGVPTPGTSSSRTGTVVVEDPNVSDSPPERIY